MGDGDRQRGRKGQIRKDMAKKRWGRKKWMEDEKFKEKKELETGKEGKKSKRTVIDEYKQAGQKRKLKQRDRVNKKELLKTG